MHLLSEPFIRTFVLHRGYTYLGLKTDTVLFTLKLNHFDLYGRQAFSLLATLFTQVKEKYLSEIVEKVHNDDHRDG